MPQLSEYIKLRTEQQKELSWGEVDSNFLYVANPWSPTRYYKEGYIVYHDADGTGGNGLGWYRAIVDNGPVSSFNVADWEAIGAGGASGTTITVTDGTTSGSVNTITVAPDDFNISIVGANANLSLKDNATKWWLPVGDPSIGAGVNNAKAIHTGQVFIGSGSTASAVYKLTVYGQSYFSDNIALANGITVDGVDISALAADYNAHTHTIVPTTLTNYSTFYPNSNNQLEDVDINTGTLATGHTLVWNNSTKKWNNQAATAAALSGLSDVQFGALSNNQILRYNTGTGKWSNITLVTSGDTGFTTAPFSHNHDTRYYTKSILNAGTGLVHWNNLTNKPTDTSDYIVASTYGGPFTNTAHRVLTSSDNSITIDITTPNVIDLTVAGVGGTIDLYEDSISLGAYAGLDFISNSFGSFSLSSVTSGIATVELIDPKVSALLNASNLGQYHNLDFTDTSNVIFTITGYTSDTISIEAESKVIVGVQQPSPSVITAYNTPRLNLAFKDNSEITWTVTDQAGTDTVAVEANLASPNQIEIYANGSLDGSFTGIDFIDGVGTAVVTSPSTGGTNSVAIDISVDLNDVCLNGFSTVTPIEITGGGTYLELTQPADVTNPSAPDGCIILTSPSGTRFAITVDDNGNLITTQL
jgi:hypothetical protein